MENESIFKKKSKITIQDFTKYFYPNMAEGAQIGMKKKTRVENGQVIEESEEDDEYERERENMPDTISNLQNPSLAGGGSSTVFLETEAISDRMSIKAGGTIFKQKLIKMEQLLLTRLQNNYSHVRKAFLDLDADADGYITAEDLAKFMKNATSTSLDKDGGKGFNFTLLELMIKLRCNSKTTNINYTNFCAWLGPSIEPVEAFYFRHDSNKNP